MAGAAAPRPKTTWSLWIATVLIGVSHSLVPAVMWPLPSKLVKPNQFGTALGLMWVVQNAGIAAGNLVAGHLNDAAGASAANPAGYQPMMAFFGMTRALGCLFALLLGTGRDGARTKRLSISRREIDAYAGAGLPASLSKRFRPALHQPPLLLGLAHVTQLHPEVIGDHALFGVHRRETSDRVLEQFFLGAVREQPGVVVGNHVRPPSRSRESAQRDSTALGADYTPPANGCRSGQQRRPEQACRVVAVRGSPVSFR
ncbi:MAG: hypothetical protein K0R70_2303 [Steroidobacteraceae bacterium]|nr:hypothetical protein [Steroidobacteraceae bacterium]